MDLLLNFERSIPPRLAFSALPRTAIWIVPRMLYCCYGMGGFQSRLRSLYTTLPICACAYTALLPGRDATTANFRMMDCSFIFVFLCVTATNVVECYPFGPPPSTCNSLLPDPYSHRAGPQNDTVPYDVDFSDFLDENGAFSYRQNRTYTCKYCVC